MTKVEFNIIDFIKSGKLAVFCGAGISCNSGVPLVNSFLEEIFTALGLPPEQRKKLKATGQPFESIMETLKQHTNIDPLLEVFDNKTPNSSHHFLTQLQEKYGNGVIVTTNFDTLLELTYKQPQNLKKTVTGKDKFAADILLHQLVKIHGCIDVAESIGIILSHIASKNLLIEKEKIIDYTFSSGPHEAVLILGYSCSDVFDIIPLIEALGDRPTKPVYLINHIAQPDIMYEPLNRQQSNNPFHMFEGVRISADTDTYITHLSSALEIELPLLICNHTGSWKRNIQVWFQQVQNQGRSCEIAGQLFKNATDYETAKQFYHRAIAIYSENNLEINYYLALSNYGYVLLKLNQPNEALKCLHACELFFEEGAAFRHSYNVVINNIGSCYQSIAKYEEAEKYYRLSLQIAIDCRDSVQVGNRLANLGNLFLLKGEFEAANEYFQKALSIAETLGDKKLTANIYHSLCAMQAKAGHFGHVSAASEEVLYIYKHLGASKSEITATLFLSESYHRRNLHQASLALLHDLAQNPKLDPPGLFDVYLSLADVYFEIDKLNEGLDYLEKAKGIWEKNQISARLAASYYVSLGCYYQMQGNPEAERNYLKEAVRIVEQDDSKENQAYIIIRLLRFYSRNELHHEAQRYFSTLKTLSEELNDYYIQQNAYQEMGHYCNRRANDGAARIYFEKALAVCESTEVKEGIGYLYDDLGTTYWNLFETDQAFIYWRKALETARRDGDSTLEKKVLDRDKRIDR